MKIENTAYRIVFWQFVVTMIAAFTCILVDWVSAYSMLLGGLTGAVPSLFMAWRFGSRPVAEVGSAFSHLVRGELGKLLLTVAMFVTSFGLVDPIDVRYYFTGLVIALVLNLVVPLLTASRKRDLAH